MKNCKQMVFQLSGSLSRMTTVYLTISLGMLSVNLWAYLGSYFKIFCANDSTCRFRIMNHPMLSFKRSESDAINLNAAFTKSTC
jgi:hypothetical protein